MSFCKDKMVHIGIHVQQVLVTAVKSCRPMDSQRGVVEILVRGKEPVECRRLDHVDQQELAAFTELASSMARGRTFGRT